MKKLSTEITLSVLLVVVLGLSALFIVTTVNVRSMTTASTLDKMNEAVTGRVNLVNEYITSLEKSVITWAQTDIFKIYCLQESGAIKEDDPVYNPNAQTIASDFLGMVKKNV